MNIWVSAGLAQHRSQDGAARNAEEGSGPGAGPDVWPKSRFRVHRIGFVYILLSILGRLTRGKEARK